MCRDLLDTEQPYSWRKNIETERERDLAIDLLLRTVLGLTEEPDKEGQLDYAEIKFFSAYNTLTSKGKIPN